MMLQSSFFRLPSVCLKRTVDPFFAHLFILLFLFRNDDVDTGDSSQDLCGELVATNEDSASPEVLEGPILLDSQSYILRYYVRTPEMGGKIQLSCTRIFQSLKAFKLSPSFLSSLG